MQTALVCLCLCLLSTALSTPVPPLPGRAAGNCVGQHRILLKGCNAKHGFYVFKYVYSFSTQRNQTQIKKEEADSQSAIPSRRLGEDNARQGPTEDRAAPEQDDNGSTDAMENGTGLKPENRSAPGVGGDAHSPRLGTGTRARGGVGVIGPTPASSEGSGDLDLVVEVDGGVSILPQGGRPGEAVAGNRSGVRGEDRDDGTPGGIPVEGAMTAGRERAPATGGAGDEGSGEATVTGQGQEGVMRGTGTGGATLTSVTEKMEDVQVDAEGVDEYAYIPDSGSVAVTHGKVGSTVRATSFTQISPDKDDEVNIFIGRANIHVGEQETTQGGATVGSEDDGIPTAGTSSPLPRLGITAAHNGDGDDGIPARRQPEGLATTATASHGDSVTSSPGDGHPTGDDEVGDTTIGDGEEPVAPGPWRVTGGDITIPAGAGIHGNGDVEVRGEGQRFEGRPGHLAVTNPRQGGDKEATAAAPAKGASIRLGATMASPRVSEGDCTTALGMTGGRKAGKSTMAGRGGSGEVGPATPQPYGEGRPGKGARVQPGVAGLDKTAKTDKVPSPRRKAGSRASSGAQMSAGGHGGNAGGRLHATEAGRSPPPQAGQARGSVAAGKGWEQGRSGDAAVAGAGGGRLPRRHGRRPGAGAPGTFAALGRSRQVDQVKRADERHVRERAFYALGGAGGGPRGSYSSLGSADSSQSSEGERGSRSDSRQTGLRPSGWGAPGHSHGRWSQGPL
ncbi:matrix extracellular phosphoglycoprotein [Gymnogyps californianus]|uniref:matrix extracellular phosphoglycoprotein n=1 Tax=Gymnogyps californianus TaxID=33616 RepID=UPI0021CA3722|nr:matrix extracellular phosphoglycoprotein [Gymnogyps californianus]